MKKAERCNTEISLCGLASDAVIPLALHHRGIHRCPTRPISWPHCRYSDIVKLSETSQAWRDIRPSSAVVIMTGVNGLIIVAFKLSPGHSALLLWQMILRCTCRFRFWFQILKIQVPVPVSRHTYLGLPVPYSSNNRTAVVEGLIWLWIMLLRKLGPTNWTVRTPCGKCACSNQSSHFYKLGQNNINSWVPFVWD